LITGILEEVVYNKRGNNRSRRQVGAWCLARCPT
jgi:hypothetical protein